MNGPINLSSRNVDSMVPLCNRLQFYVHGATDGAVGYSRYLSSHLGLIDSILICDVYITSRAKN